MIGLLYGLYVVGAAVVDGVSGAVENHELKEHGRELQAEGKNPAGIYLDRHGATRLINTGELCKVDPAINENEGKDVCVRDIHGNVIRNLTEEKRSVKAREAAMDGRTVYLYNYRGNHEYDNYYDVKSYCKGSQYKDLDTGEIYVARKFFIKDRRTHISFYMDFEGNLIRETDSYKISNEKVLNEKEVEDFILKFNEAQSNGNGWKGYKKDIYPTDCLGKKRAQPSCFALDQFYCNKEVVWGDC